MAAGGRSLEQWLRWQEALHPQAMDLGLERVGAVWENLGAPRPARRVITVAGTNGKGSTVACIEAAARAAGLAVGCYTSPHLLRYNERLRLQGRDAPDARWCRAFAAVEAARDGIPLTYFEFGTLAALRALAREDLDLAVLEVGLGGRLDAVNVVDPDLAVLTPVALDHQHWLGADREAIGAEKAGILRPGIPAVCSDRDPPASVLAEARRLGVSLWCLGRDFDLRPAGEDREWRGPPGRLRLPSPGGARVQADNAAAAVAALVRLWPGRDWEGPAAAMAGAVPPGRFQLLSESPELRADVAHNPAAARALAATLEAGGGPVQVVLGMLADKDVEGFARALAGVAGGWFPVGLDVERGLDGAALHQRLRRVLPAGRLHPPATLPLALEQARAAAGREGRVLVTGSFHTVAQALALRV